MQSVLSVVACSQASCQWSHAAQPWWIRRQWTKPLHSSPRRHRSNRLLCGFVYRFEVKTLKRAMLQSPPWHFDVSTKTWFDRTPTDESYVLARRSVHIRILTRTSPVRSPIWESVARPLNSSYVRVLAIWPPLMEPTPSRQNSRRVAKVSGYGRALQGAIVTLRALREVCPGQLPDPLRRRFFLSRGRLWRYPKQLSNDRQGPGFWSIGEEPYMTKPLEAQGQNMQ